MISTEQKNIILETLKPFNPSYVGLFGSYARNEESEDSDIDVLVEFEHDGISLFDIGGWYYDLEEKLKRKVDISFRQNLKARVKSYVMKDVITLFGK